MTRSDSLFLSLALGACVACGGSSTPRVSLTQAIAETSGALPRSADEAEQRRRAGASWSNGQIRAHYLAQVAEIGRADARWRSEGKSAETRAHLAYAMRNDAKRLMRAMMTDEELLAAFRASDQRKFGHPEGPTFDELVAKQRERGVTGDAVFEAIVVSAQKTDPIVDQLMVGAGD
jgi:hypothetical protein